MSKVKMNSKENIVKADEASTKIDAIKQLLFGENMQEYDSEFESVKKDILNKKHQLEVLIEDIKSELIQSIDNLSTDLNIRMTELEDKYVNKIEHLEHEKVDRKLLGELFSKLAEKINQ